jgi:hypothetical protein
MSSTRTNSSQLYQRFRVGPFVHPEFRREAPTARSLCHDLWRASTMSSTSTNSSQLYQRFRVGPFVHRSSAEFGREAPTARSLCPDLWRASTMSSTSTNSSQLYQRFRVGPFVHRSSAEFGREAPTARSLCPDLWRKHSDFGLGRRRRKRHAVVEEYQQGCNTNSARLGARYFVHCEDSQRDVLVAKKKTTYSRTFGRLGT